MPDLLLFPPPTRKPAPASSPVNTLHLSDPEARAAALDIHRSWIVEAPAGSGKTGLLIQRYLTLLAHGHVRRPADILVLTFTRKADGELRDRVLAQLAAAQANTPLAPDASAFDGKTRSLTLAVLARDHASKWRILDSPTQLNIRTIDSFCAELAASTPLLVSGSARRSPTDDAFPLYRAAAERTLAALGGPDPALHHALEHLLLHRDAQVQDCLSLIALMLAQREQWGELIPLRAHELDDHHLDTVVRPRLERTLARIVADGLSRAADALGPENLVELATFAARNSTEPGYSGNPNPLAACEGLRGASSPTGENHRLWISLVGLLLKDSDGGWRKRLAANDLGIDLPKNERLWLEQFIQQLKYREGTYPQLREVLAEVRSLPPATYPGMHWSTVKALSRILAHALIELQQVFTQRGQTDFIEIALAARSLLRPEQEQLATSTHDPLNNPSTQLTHLLVDEMQDTSAGQYKLLEALTASWDGASQTVFLVGDPKQSIYAFRQARVERFLRTMDTGLLGDLPLGALRLTANFRSQAALVDAFNQTFSQILPTPADLAGPPAPQHGAELTSTVPFVAATPVRPATQSPALHWHALLKPDAEEVSTLPHPAESQARQIRDIIDTFLENWPNRPHVPGEQSRPPKIAVLARNRGHLAPVLSELRGSPGHGPLLFRAVDVEALDERPEVLDLLALTRALLHPADRVAWLAVLRSPLCGLARADLLALTGEGPQADPEATIAHLVPLRTGHLSSEGQALLQRTWPTLLTAQATLGSTSLSTQVERAWRSLGGDAPLRPDQRTNALRFLDLLGKLETGPEPLSLSLLEQSLKRLYAQPFAGEAAVELMTIHKAKGLEWDLVLVPSLERGSGRNPHGLLKWLELDNPDGEADFLLAPIQPKGEEVSNLSSWLTKNEGKRAVAEAQRLFYVACTRAREELHLFATVERSKSGALCTPRNQDSLLRAAWKVAEPVLAQQTLVQPPTATPTSNNLVNFPARASTLTLAAAAEQTNEAESGRRTPTLQRLPASFDLQSRFRRENGPSLPYPPASDLARTAAFPRPEGSFAARAFGNVVHRFLQLLATRLATPQTPGSLLNELPGWLARLTATLRNEGLPLTLATAEAQRVLATLFATLNDPEGAWLLGPHRDARTEAPVGSPTSTLRADRTFLAGPFPLAEAPMSHLWIVDYKTAELGGRSTAAFLAGQKSKYGPQMLAYARAAAAAGTSPSDIVLALYFPLLPALLHWPATEALPLQ